MSEDTPRKDAFIEMVTAKASVDLRLGDYHPRSMLVVPEHEVRHPRFPVIDYHNHLDAQDPQSVLRIMDECGIELIVNIEYPSHASRQGRWNIHGLFFPDEVLRCVYRDNANRILKRPV